MKATSFSRYSFHLKFSLTLFARAQIYCAFFSSFMPNLWNYFLIKTQSKCEYIHLFQGVKFVRLWNSVWIVCVRLLMRSTQNFDYLIATTVQMHSHWFWSKQYQNNQNALEFTVAENFISYCFKHIGIFSILWSNPFKVISACLFNSSTSKCLAFHTIHNIQETTIRIEICLRLTPQNKCQRNNASMI